MIRLLTPGPLAHGIKRVRHRKPAVVVQEADPRGHGLVFGEEARGAGVGDVVFAGFVEDVVCYGVADEAFEVYEIHVDSF